MASGSLVYENRTVWDVEESWNLLTWQDFDDNGPQLPQAALAVDQGSLVTQSGLSLPSIHPPHLNDCERTLSPSNYSTSIAQPVALLNIDPGNNHNDASVLCNSETLREPRRDAIDNPKHCLPLPDTILANDACRSTTKQNNKLTKTITHLKQSREYLECLEEYSLYCYKKLTLIGTQPAPIERSEEETYMSTLSLWSILIFMENMLVRMRAQIRTEEEWFHELQERGMLSIEDCRKVLKAQGRVYVGGGGSQVWPQGMLVKDMVDGFELVQGDLWKPLRKQQRISEVFRGSTILLREYQEQEKVWLSMGNRERDAAKGELADVIWTVWRQGIQGFVVLKMWARISSMTHTMTDNWLHTLQSTMLKKPPFYPPTLKRRLSSPSRTQNKKQRRQIDDYDEPEDISLASEILTLRSKVQHLQTLVNRHQVNQGNVIVETMKAEVGIQCELDFNSGNECPEVGARNWTVQVDHDSSSITEGGIRNIQVQSASDNGPNLKTYFMTLFPFSSAPPWFGQAFEFLNRDFGVEYAELLQLWMRFEQIHQWKNPKSKLADLLRPRMLNDWSKRRSASIPALSTVALVQHSGESVWTWWCSLQPPWRSYSVSKNRLNPVSIYGTDWKSLNKSGKNGWMLIITCVKWWREGLESLTEDERQELEKDWYTAMDDISRMLKGLIEYITT
ncbi:uncharacterized protein C8R40DRAFT_1068351 [Lentinula edodes]|uniref:uncharacterized protein n=1 Tax=Lentinula edodes TaxID=5353 RepID=UPI001E8E8D50|nr:uncharacterized protein C8R40DRAFT_1068351 [Lentinula edodes]KAH7876540.1 hypothetical protein C8R40DRAFT_1068351 [Lentinula edodes]